MSEEGFPGGSVVKKCACQCKRHRFDPWSWKIPQAVEQLSPCATVLSLCSRAWKPTALEPKLRNKSNHHNEKSVHCN